MHREPSRYPTRPRNVHKISTHSRPWDLAANTGVCVIPGHAETTAAIFAERVREEVTDEAARSKPGLMEGAPGKSTVWLEDNLLHCCTGNVAKVLHGAA